MRHAATARALERARHPRAGRHHGAHAVSEPARGIRGFTLGRPDVEGIVAPDPAVHTLVVPDPPDPED